VSGLESTHSARRVLPFRGRLHRDVADGQLELFGVQAAPGLTPESGRAFEVSLA
jgi:hypothetical protein